MYVRVRQLAVQALPQADGIDSSAALRHNTRENEEPLSGATAVGPARGHLVRDILEGRQRGTPTM